MVTHRERVTFLQPSTGYSLHGYPQLRLKRRRTELKEENLGGIGVTETTDLEILNRTLERRLRVHFFFLLLVRPIATPLFSTPTLHSNLHLLPLLFLFYITFFYIYMLLFWRQKTDLSRASLSVLDDVTIISSNKSKKLPSLHRERKKNKIIACVYELL